MKMGEAMSEYSVETSAAVKDRILILGATGYFGQKLLKASLALGHPTSVLCRPENKADRDKCQRFMEFHMLGASLVHGSLDDHNELVSILKKVDVVISAVGWNRILEQRKLINAIKEAGTIKRFLPTEFGMDVDRMGHATPPGDQLFKDKVSIRRAIEEAGIPHTYISCNCFAGIFLSGLAQLGSFMPPRDRVDVYGDGDKKCIYVDEYDAAMYSIMTVSDPRTINQIVFTRPPKNNVSQMEVIKTWEKLIGKQLKKTFVSAKKWLALMDGLPIYEQIAVAHIYQIYFLGDLDFQLESGSGLDTNDLYPNYNYVRIEDYLKRFI